MALTANIHRDPKKGRPAKPSDFNPHPQPKAAPPPKVSMAEVKNLLLGGKKGKRTVRRVKREPQT